MLGLFDIFKSRSQCLDPEAPENHRYIEGQKLYLSSSDPKKFATLTVNNNDLTRPRIIYPRNWMRFQLKNCNFPLASINTTPILREHASALARLMDLSFTGTIDHEGETLEQCFEEIKCIIEGKYGPFIGPASFVTLDGTTATSASMITVWKEYPLLAFSMTDPDYQGRGLAAALIRKSLAALKLAGYKDLFLVVTAGNAAAESLYRKVGFEFLGPAVSGRGPLD